MENKNVMKSDLEITSGLFKRLVAKYFNIMPDKENETETVQAISNGVAFHGAKLWILVFAIFMASLGLNVNSTAVIIGAMLISPLMGPIIGMGMAVGINDIALLKRSAKKYAVATVISVMTATVYFLLTPLDEAQSELLARTSPTLYDVMIALFGGAAGIVALCTKDKGNVLPGVAIATALMPPLCTAGFGLATGNIYYFLGAFYLFFINTVFISLATYLGVRLMKFKELRFADTVLRTRVKRYIIAIVTATMVPAGIMTYGIVRESILKSNIRRFISGKLDTGGTRIVSYDIVNDKSTLRVVAVGKELTSLNIRNAEKFMSDYNIEKYKLQVIQGTKSDSVMMLSDRLAKTRISAENYEAMLRQEAEKTNALQKKLLIYTAYSDKATDVSKELKALFPSVTDISLSTATQASLDSLHSKKTYAVAIVGLKQGRSLSWQDRKALHDFLKARLSTDTLRLITTNPGL